MVVLYDVLQIEFNGTRTGFLLPNSILEKPDEQSDGPKSRVGRFLVGTFFAATSVIAVVRASQSHAHSSYDLGPRVALSHRSPWFVS